MKALRHKNVVQLYDVIDPSHGTMAATPVGEQPCCLRDRAHREPRTTGQGKRGDSRKHEYVFLGASRPLGEVSQC